VCGVVVEEASREGEVTGSNHGSCGARDFTRKNARLATSGDDGDGWVAGQWGSSPK
jgi:hypothetical protein